MFYIQINNPLLCLLIDSDIIHDQTCWMTQFITDFHLTLIMYQGNGSIKYIMEE
jgi:hypothetical protein